MLSAFLNDTPTAAPKPAEPPKASASYDGVQKIVTETDVVIISVSCEDDLYNLRYPVPHGTVGIIQRGTTVGVKQFIKGKWETLYNQAEAEKRFG